LIVLWIVIKNRLDVKLATVLHEKRIKALTSQLQKLEEKQQASITGYQNENYAILGIECTDELFVFRITFSGTINKNIPPIFMINGMRVLLENVKGNQASCYIGKLPFLSNSEYLVFTSGGTNKGEVLNPYIAADREKIGVVWQCRGHTCERKILLSPGFFKSPTRGIVYPFSLLVNGRKIGEFLGIINGQNIEIPLKKKVNEGDCIGKECILRYTVGNSVQKIPLPSPTVLTVNGTQA